MDELAIKRAERSMRRGMEAVNVTDFKAALEHFKLAATQNPTAEAFTYWGWMEFQLGNTYTAIELCEKAIALDPDFGNPYNDIGSYLVSLGRPEDAIAWLEKAKKARDYEPRQFPYINLGKIYLAKDMNAKALREFEAALELVPQDPFLADVVQKLRNWESVD